MNDLSSDPFLLKVNHLWGVDLMKVLAINGSPRKQRNTADMLQAAVDLAVRQGETAELIHLYDLQYMGCHSCFACKRINGSSFGKCIIQDELTPVLQKILCADIVLFGQPIYFGFISSGMWALLERLWFAGMNYDETYSSNYPGNVICGMVFTMNAPHEELYERTISFLCENMSRQLGPTESFAVTYTMQFDDYSKYVSSAFDAKSKKEWHLHEYPKQKTQLLQWVQGLMVRASKR